VAFWRYFRWALGDVGALCPNKSNSTSFLCCFIGMPDSVKIDLERNGDLALASIWRVSSIPHLYD